MSIVPYIKALWPVPSCVNLTTYVQGSSDYEIICQVLQKLNEMVHSFNTLDDAVTELSEKFDSLESFVNNYFDNLDLQEEVNNKLQSMYAEGLFQQMFSDYFGVAATPQIYGAKGDGVTDDSEAISECLNSNNNITFPSGTYLINNGIVVNKNNNLGPLSIDASKATIIYTGSDVAFTFTGVQNADLSFGRINANSGSCIKFSATGSDDSLLYNQYINLNFTSMRSANDCVLISSEDSSWSNQIIIKGGRFETGINGIRLINNSDQPMDMITAEQVGFEVVSNGFNIDEGTGIATRFTIINPRYVEMADGIVLKTSGRLDGLFMYGSETARSSWFDIGENSTNVTIFTPQSGLVTYNVGNRSTLNSLQNQQILTDGSDLNSVVMPGNYCSTSSAKTSSLQNKPLDLNSAFTLEVLSSNGANVNNIINTSDPYIYIIQSIRTLRGNTVYYRYGNTNGSNVFSWGEWVASYRSVNDVEVTSGNIPNTNCHCYSKNGVIYLYINGSASSTDPTNVLSVPSAYAPKEQIAFVCSSNDECFRAYVTTAGVVGFQSNPSSGTAYSGFVCWPYE